MVNPLPPPFLPVSEAPQDVLTRFAAELSALPRIWSMPSPSGPSRPFVSVEGIEGVLGRLRLALPRTPERPRGEQEKTLKEI